MLLKEVQGENERLQHKVWSQQCLCLLGPGCSSNAQGNVMHDSDVACLILLCICMLRSPAKVESALHLA